MAFKTYQMSPPWTDFPKLIAWDKACKECAFRKTQWCGPRWHYESQHPFFCMHRVNENNRQLVCACWMAHKKAEGL